MAVNKDVIMEALKGVIDPEIGLDVVSLGLVYDVDVPENGEIKIKMTMTTPGCPLAMMITTDAKNILETIDGVKSADVELVWDPPWSPDMMDPEVRARLGI